MGAVAAAAYGAAGGPAAFGLPSGEPGHAEAMSAALRLVAYGCAGALRGGLGDRVPRHPEAPAHGGVSPRFPSPGP